ncbi:MAG TPA: hypothetical protein VHO69_19205, partial [Phototrophicaceae bacterium]|nr:hypothetical protein [Phototrophicaceae bacterium]
MAATNYQRGLSEVRYYTIFSAMLHRVRFNRLPENNLCPREGYLLVTTNGVIHVHPRRYAEPEEWTYVLIHALLHLAFGHFQERNNPLAWNVACDCYITRFMQDLKFGRAPAEMDARIEGLPRTEENLYRLFCEEGIPDALLNYSTAGKGVPDMLIEPEEKQSYLFGKPLTWTEAFGAGLNSAVSEAVDKVGGVVDSEARNTPGQKARAWFINNYPLLGALAANFKIIEDVQLCQRQSITIAAVDAETREIYLNPAVYLGGHGAPLLEDEELRFILAHELLHVGLRHQARRQGRDPFLWNVACDYVINLWLVEMGVGRVPSVGLLLDHELRGMNAEAIYDRIANDMRTYRKLATLRGFGLGDMLEGERPEWWATGAGVSLDEFYRRALTQGLEYVRQTGRGYLPAELIEEIMAMSQPPVPWDVQLAHWFDEHFPPLEKVRTYARPSRRQSSTPDIPRPRYIPDPRTMEGRTFGVILDTSGSMDSRLLAKVLGTIASYSIAREVHAVRVVFCD